MEILTGSASQTQKVGEDFANRLKGGETIALTGDLGSGKTTFVQGLGRGLGVKARIISPTFIFMRQYRIGKDISHLYHVDLYRLEENAEQEVRGLGIDEIWGKDGNVVVIEWAEKIRNMLPAKTVWIGFENLGSDTRKVIINQL